MTRCCHHHPLLVTRRCPQGVSTCRGPSWWTWSRAPWTRCARDPSGRSSGRTTSFSVSPRVTRCPVGSPVSPCHVLLGDPGVPIPMGWSGGFPLSPPWWPMGAFPSGVTHLSLVALRCFVTAGWQVPIVPFLVTRVSPYVPRAVPLWFWEGYWGPQRGRGSPAQGDEGPLGDGRLSGAQGALG